MTCFSDAFDCTDLPDSMNGPDYYSGCAGAVFKDGSRYGKPSKYYCNGNGYNGASYPWWKQCCRWNGSKCQPK